ncbi:TPA: HEPN domain-containing protein [Citrobacter freundii]|uniref:HEPN domain-containing protein n=1 Tax=Citrobacter freundii TaxID=546 RepID=UPI00116037E9|nr:HEPN domain-containing protein [Citrobacter freundii]MBJ8716277.1 hypothetical protein [Citrobacter freundii]MBJ9566416.1 hypothetical protein [Citrobacter freundii]MEB2474695.1 HEPN domain-containing protein [Citrobacter freundii]NMR04430.1 hypothetical protein [Citrobacter freundii]HAT3454087.1 hypothetical protein [Citrobacter freundii]
MMLEMHTKSVEKIKDLIRELLECTEMKNGIPRFNYESYSFDKIACELNKRKTVFKVDNVACMFIYFDGLSIFFRSGGDYYNKCVTHPISVDEFDSVLDFILSLYRSTPMNYKISIPLKHLYFKINDSEEREVNVIEQRMENINHQEKALSFSSIQISGSGIFYVYGENFFMKDILLKLNIFIFQLLINNVVEIKNSRPVLLDYWHKYKIHDIPVIKAKIQNNDYPKIEAESLIPISLSKYLGDLTLTEKGDGSNSAEKVTLSMIAAECIIKDKTREGERIKSAIDWFMQSQANEDLTMSFLQMCMGLEAIFGDDDNDGGLTNILADRCSYLIGKNIEERKEIKSNFREVYRLRSKIVHGVKSNLSPQEMSLRYNAINYLRRSILKEILNMDAFSIK